MEFNSLTFLLITLPIFIGLMYFIKHNVVRNVLVLVFSLFFYAFGDLSHFPIIIIVSILTYVFGRIVKGKGKLYTLYLVLVLLVLSIFKYGNYLLDAIDEAMIFGIDKIVMPMGISFYIFTSISYVSDCYYEKYEYESNFFKVLMFLTFFPTVVSGPLIRYDTFKSFIEEKDINLERMSNGFRRFVIGLGRKVLIANQLGLVCSTLIKDDMSLSFAMSCFALVAYSLQLFYDFAGYSDMAIGLGEMIGYTIPENFDDPYFSHSIAEFWRRWHITLGTWFKEYVYYPLLRSKFCTKIGLKLAKEDKKKARKITNVVGLFIMWTLIGAWHGAEIRYVLYGLYHGFFVIMTTIFSKSYDKILNKLHINKDSKLFKAFQIVRTFLIVTLGYILFRCANLNQMKCVIKGLLFRNGFVNINYLRRLNILYLLFYLVIGFIFMFPCVKKLFNKIKAKVPFIYDLLLVCLLALSVIYIVSGSYSAFIYFNF